MTYTHLTTNELVMIEAYYQENIKVSDIVASLGRSKQTIYNVINYLKEGHSAYDYYNRYKINKKRCGRNKTSLTQSEKDFIQTHLEKNWSLDVIKGTYPDRVSCSMRTLYRLADRGILKKEDLPWKGKRKPNGHSEKRGKQALRRDLRERADSYPNFKTEFGHLEGDTIVGEKHKSAVITLVERLSKAIITLKTIWKLKFIGHLSTSLDLIVLLYPSLTRRSYNILGKTDTILRYLPHSYKKTDRTNPIC